MKIHLEHLSLRTRQTTEDLRFADVVTFLHGPVSTGKSTVARLVDYCFGGELERTPALQQEFVAVELFLTLGAYDCAIERAADDNQSVRVTWEGEGDDRGSVNAPFRPRELPLVGEDVFTFSDLVFHLCGVTPIKVRQRSQDPTSPMIRLSIRDVWRYCYLDQTHLDSSFFQLEDPFRGRKSQDAMRFFTGLHSERMSQLESELLAVVDGQRTKREAVVQIRQFMARFELGSEAELLDQVQATAIALEGAERRRGELESTRSTQTHPTDTLRDELRGLSAKIEGLRQALAETANTTAQQRALRAEFITAKIKSERVERAGSILDGVEFGRCPACGTDVSARPHDENACGLCGSIVSNVDTATSAERESMRRDLNERIDEIGEAMARRELESERTARDLGQLLERKALLDARLQMELNRYDSAFVEAIRGTEREIATLVERKRSLQRLQQMPRAIDELEEQAGALQGQIDRLRNAAMAERIRLRGADANIAALAAAFKRVMLAVSFPGVVEDDQVVIDPRNWKPTIVHGQQEWTYWDTGSGGKKTLFNVCYALALHAVAIERNMPVPSLLIIDSPTKNISDDENPELVEALYAEIYRLATGPDGLGLQFLLIDSDLGEPWPVREGFSERRMAAEAEAPSLIPYYVGP